MSLSSDSQGIDGLFPTSTRGSHTYEPSVASSTSSSSQFSVFSDAGSEHSSIASSISDDFRLNYDEARDGACAQAQLHSSKLQGAYDITAASVNVANATLPTRPGLSYADVTSAQPELRQHSRRSSLARNQKPPTLQRQQDRKTHFVDSLVDSASQMVEVIWPLSVVPCRGENGGGRGVLPLRTYIEETLRRSRTSYSTLQVALYYLVLIRPFVPKSDFTREQQTDCPASRALMCGRRMFLAALILASKYLQDRNYSAKAWSKMSGLSVCEINTNERIFLAKVDFKLHIPDAIFSRWTEIVLKFTPNTQPPPPGHGYAAISSWKSIIPVLTPALDTVSLPEMRAKATPKASAAVPVANFGYVSPTTPTPTPRAMNIVSLHSTSHETTPTPATALPPRFLEPKPDLLPPTPALARLGPLPTPQLTPSSVASSTPAVSACGSRRPSMCSAMALAQKTSFDRCAVDTYPFMPTRERCGLTRRPSITSAASSRSSPESMISDRSRSSRASSISSVSTIASTASLAPSRADLARLATCRKARMPLPPATVAEEREGSAAQPIVIADDIEMTASPDLTNFSISEKRLHAPHKHSKYAPLPITADRGRKRCRSRGTRRSNLHEEVRLMLEEDLEIDARMEVDEDEVHEIEVVDLIDEDDTGSSPAPAVDYASRLLASSQQSADVVMLGSTKSVQPPASLSRENSCRRPVLQRNDGSKRSCCSTGGLSLPLAMAMSALTPNSMYAEAA